MKEIPIMERLQGKFDVSVAAVGASSPIWMPQLVWWLQLLLAIGGLLYLACRFYVLKLVYQKIRAGHHVTESDVREGAE